MSTDTDTCQSEVTILNEDLENVNNGGLFKRSQKETGYSNARAAQFEKADCTRLAMQGPHNMKRPIAHDWKCRGYAIWKGRLHTRLAMLGRKIGKGRVHTTSNAGAIQYERADCTQLTMQRLHNMEGPIARDWKCRGRTIRKGRMQTTGNAGTTQYERADCTRQKSSWK